jgi:uncharacterized SAM-binding protein YcdF (DUF218 family)
MVGAPPGEAVLMRELALAHGVADDRIVVEGRSRNTFENALFTGRIIRDRQWREVVIVTDHFHLMRALYVFRRLGLAVVGEGVRRPDDVSRLYWYTAYLDEAVRTVRSASLFLIGAHKSEVDRVLPR